MSLQFVLTIAVCESNHLYKYLIEIHIIKFTKC